MAESTREWTYRLFAPEKGGRTGYFADWFIMTLIALNVAAVVLETVAAVGEPFARELFWFEVVSVAIFTVEYAARLWSSVEHPAFEGRFRFALRPIMLVDLLAILPFYLMFLGLPGDLRFLRALRLLRILRLFKLARYSESMKAFRLVYLEKKPDLVIALFANGILLVIASAIVYTAEHATQPETFSSIPATMWWGIATLTTVGYGDMTPVTPLGQFFGAITALLGIGLFALPASILAAGFIEETGQSQQCPHCGESFDEKV